MFRGGCNAPFIVCQWPAPSVSVWISSSPCCARGTATVFWPQKGLARASMMAPCSRQGWPMGLAHQGGNRVTSPACREPVRQAEPGSRRLPISAGRLVPGAELLLDLTGFEAALAAPDLVIAEGSLDRADAWREGAGRCRQGGRPAWDSGRCGGGPGGAVASRASPRRILDGLLPGRHRTRRGRQHGQGSGAAQGDRRSDCGRLYLTRALVSTSSSGLRGAPGDCLP